MRKTILSIALLAGLGSIATIASADPPAHSNARANKPASTAPATTPVVDPAMPAERATIPPGQVVPRDPAGDAPRGQIVSQVAHATRDFKGLDSNRDGIIQRTELPADHGLVSAWTTYDLDTNASLSRAEFDAYVLATVGIDTEDEED